MRPDACFTSWPGTCGRPSRAATRHHRGPACTYAPSPSRGPSCVVGFVVSVLVPVLTLPRLPQLSPGRCCSGVAPWVVGKYVLCPLRWRVLTSAPTQPVVARAGVRRGRAARPAHPGPRRRRRLAGPPADPHRARPRRRRPQRGHRPAGRRARPVRVRALRRHLAAAVVGAVSGGITVLALVAALVVRRVRPDLLPRRPLPPPRRLAQALCSRPATSSRSPPC